jgi:hypothetical protein
MMFAVIRRRFLLVALLSLLAGCSGDWGSASGTVLLDGKPLPEADITFHPVSPGAPGNGRVVDGAFTIKTGTRAGLAVGSYKVVVHLMTIPDPNKPEPAKLLTPEKYLRTETTDLAAEVKPGSNSYKFEMYSKR